MTARRRAAWPLLACLPLLWLVSALAAGLRPADAGEPADEADDTRIRLVEQTAWVAPDGDFAARVQVQDAPPGADVVVSLYDNVPNRISFARTIDDDPSLGFRIARNSLDEAVGATGSATVPVTIGLQAENRDPTRTWLTEAGVYPVRVEVTDRGGTPVAELVTHLLRGPGAEELTRAGDEGIEPLATSLVLPFGAPPALRPDGTTELATREREQLAVVAAAVASNPAVPVVLVPTPETVDALAGPDDGMDLLGPLQGALDASQVLARPYVDLDLAAWEAADLDDELATQFTRGAAVIDAELGRPDGRTWVGERDLTPRALELLRQRGVDQVVVPEASLEPLDERDFPTTLTRPFVIPNTVGATQRAMPADRQLQAHLAPSDDAVLAGHHLLADLAVLYFDRPDLPHGAVVVPPDRWSPSAELLDVVLEGLDTSPLLTPTTLDDLFDQLPLATEGGQTDTSGAPLERAVEGEPPGSLGNYPAALAAARRQLTSYRGMIGLDNPRVAPLQERVLTSASRDLEPDGRLAYLAGFDDALRAELASIDVPDRQSVTLAAREGSVPLTLRNGLDYPVDVVVHIESSERLRFPDGEALPLTLTEGPNRIDLRVEARTAGDSPLRVRITSPDGRIEVAATQFRVRSTAISGVGLVLTLGAGLFLAGWWAGHFRNVRRDRRLVAREHHPTP
ncbi:hypothetical protein BH20ACT2_BH20ACT2_11950 [soil metagenome]